MQEGTPAFVLMAEISRALMAHRAAGLPYLVHLRHPTTGGVYASWGSVGTRDGRRARGAGRLPRSQGLRGAQRAPVPTPGVQVAENLAAVGVIDGVVAVEDLPAMVDLALGVLVDKPGPGRLAGRSAQPLSGVTRGTASSGRDAPTGSVCATSSPTAPRAPSSCAAPTRASATRP